MKFSRQVIVLGAAAGVAVCACGLGIVGSEPAPIAEDGGGGGTAPPVVGPVVEAGPPDAGDVDAADGGPHGVALELDGLDDFVRAERTVADTFTLEAWIQTTATLDGTKFFEGVPILWADVALDRDDFGLGILGGKLAFGATGTTVVSTATVNTGAWVHVAVVRKKSPASIALFVNGIADATGTGPNRSLTDSPTLDIGGNLIDKRFFKGRIREVRVWNVARTGAEIAGGMDLALTGNEPGLMAYWRFADGSGTTAADSSGNGNPGTLGIADAGADASSRPTWVTF